MATGGSQATGGSVPRHGTSIYIAFVPWILFSIITRRLEVESAAVVALVASIVIALPSLRSGRPKLLEIGAVVAFVGFTLVAFAGDDATRDWLARYARAISAALLALIAFGSLARTPFTEQYARESVPPELWGTATFRHINRQITAMWGVVFLLMVPSHIVAGAIDTRRAFTFFNWVIPIALIVVAVKWTARLSGAPNETETRPARAP